MTLVDDKIIAAVVVFIAGLATAIYPLKKKHALSHTESFELGEALASGIFLGAAFFHMLPDAIKLFGQVNNAMTYPIPEAICLSGFLLMLFLERLSLTRSAQHSKLSIPYILAIILIIHALTEGAALGIGTTLSETTMIFIAIIAHKGSESFALCITMLRHHLPTRRIMAIIVFFALMTPIGIGLGMILHQLAFVGDQGKLLAASFDAFAAGTFLYISTLHHTRFHQHSEETHGMTEFACLVLGLVTMGVIALWA